MTHFYSPSNPIVYTSICEEFSRTCDTRSMQLTYLSSPSVVVHLNVWSEQPLSELSTPKCIASAVKANVHRVFINFNVEVRPDRGDASASNFVLTRRVLDRFLSADFLCVLQIRSQRPRRPDIVLQSAFRPFAHLTIPPRFTKRIAGSPSVIIDQPITVCQVSQRWKDDRRGSGLPLPA